MQFDTAQPVKKFIDQRLTPTLDSTISGDELFKAFVVWNNKQWEADHQSTVSYSRTLFGIRASEILSKRRTNTGIEYLGVSLIKEKPEVLDTNPPINREPIIFDGNL